MSYFRLFLVACSALLITASSAWAIDLDEGFEVQFPPPGWTAFTTGDGVDGWERSAFAENTGTYGAISDDNESLTGGEEHRRWLATPPLVIDNVADEISYWINASLSFSDDVDFLYILVSTTDQAPASFTDTLASLQPGIDFVSSYEQRTHNLSAYLGQTIHIAFQHYIPGPVDGSFDFNQLYLDDILGPEVIAPPFAATDPDPVDGAIGTAVGTNLNWVNGGGTATLDLYLSATLSEVENDAPAALILDDVAATTSYDPPSDLLPLTQYYWKVVDRNAQGDADATIWSFYTTGTPLAGTYDIGGATPDYDSFTAAFLDLQAAGISDDVTFDVYGGDYDERIIVEQAIPGVSVDDQVTFSDASGTARLVHTADEGSSRGVLEIEEVSWITFDGIDFLADLGTDYCVKFGGNVTNCTWENSSWTSQSDATVGGGLWGLGAGNNNNTFDNLVIVAHESGLRFPNTGTGTVVSNCTISGVENGIELNDHEATIFNNDIMPNQGGTTSAYGLDVAGLTSGQVVEFYNNKVHDVVSSSSTGSGLVYVTGDAGSIVRVYNNFLYDVNVSGTGDAQGGDIEGSGTVDFYNNSISIENAATTGDVYGLEIGGSSGTYNVRNNIFYLDVVSNPTVGVYGLLGSYAPAVLDNNVYYINPANNNWLIHDVGDEYADLDALQAGTDFEDNGREGDPGFLSTTDLHIDPSIGVVSNGGFPVAYITTDIDGDTRSGTPDIGADEYTFLAPPNDYVIRELIGFTELNPELSAVNLDVWVQNAGSDDQTDVPVNLYYQGGLEQTILVSLLAEESDTISFTWNTPAAPSSGQLEVEHDLASDAFPENDSLTFDVVIVGQPLNGSYDLGGGNNDYADFATIQTDLTLRGVDGAVTVNVYPGTYSENFRLGEVPGHSAVNTITFVGVEATLDEPPVLEGAVPVLDIDSLDYFTWDNIDLTATNSGEVVEIKGGADFNTITNSTITGASNSSSSVSGVEIFSDDNDNNTISNNTFAGSYHGVYLAGSSSDPNEDNVVTGNHILECKKGVYVTYNHNARIDGNDIEVGYGAATGEIWGVEVSTIALNDTAWVCNNLIHNFRSTGSSNGVETDVGSGYAVFYNNMIYDWQVTGGTVRGFNVDGDDAAFYFNSVFINDVTGPSTIQAYFQLSSTSTTVLMNNVFNVEEQEETCYSIYRSSTSGSLTSDYNDFYGTGAGYNVGYLSSARATLLDWQTANSSDANSISAFPGFVSNTDLHIAPAFDALDNAGVAIAGITTDIDGDARTTPPCIGADEYEFAPSDIDYNVIGFVGLLASYPAASPTTIDVDVENLGVLAAPATNVILYYNGVEQDIVSVALGAGERDTLTFDWTPPNVGFQIGELEAQAFAASDGFGDNDSTVAEVIILGPPMNGDYDLGGGDNDFASFADAVLSLQLRGVDGPVVIDVYDGTYNEHIVFDSEITGADAINTITFQEHVGVLDDVVILENSVDNEIVLIDGADFITFDGFDVNFTGDCEHGFYIEGDADFISVLNCNLTGADDDGTDFEGVHIGLDDNDNLTVEGCTIVGCAYGIRYNGGSGSCQNADIGYNEILGARYGVYIDDVHAAHVHHNDIQGEYGGTSSSTDVYSIYLSSLSDADTDSVYVYANEIHNIHMNTTTGGTSAEMIGIYSLIGTNKIAMIYNNFIYDFVSNGGTPQQWGIDASTGIYHVYNNSFYLNDIDNVDATDGIAAINSTSSSGDWFVYNNVIRVDEATGEAFAFNVSSSSTDFVSNNNLVHLPGNGDYAEFSSTVYADLSGYNSATGNGAVSIEGDPLFASPTDLHVGITSPASDAGVSDAIVTTFVTEDIDGDLRNDPPDIGADEFDALVAPDDLTVYRDGQSGVVTLRWSAVPNANSYVIYGGDTEDFILEPASELGTTGDVMFDVALGANGIQFFKVVSSLDPPALRVNPNARNLR